MTGERVREDVERGGEGLKGRDGERERANMLQGDRCAPLLNRCAPLLLSQALERYFLVKPQQPKCQWNALFWSRHLTFGFFLSALILSVIDQAWVFELR